MMQGTEENTAFSYMLQFYETLPFSITNITVQSERLVLIV